MAGEVILIIEDNEKNLKLVRDVLQFKGYQTLEAGTAEDGLRLVHAHQPALVLLDIQLPGVDGFAAFAQLRADPATRSIPVIAITASAMAQDRERILAAGFDGYQAKPISVRALQEMVRHLLDARADGRAGQGGPLASSQDHDTPA